ncbi:hypothetical protein M0R45_011110 [Rubus argutus]|uniref:Uncharacterized protein n=1 Tax=Rubus argutus TaxID=59490 RepID=A0AAW1YCR5_RUBAR
MVFVSLRYFLHAVMSGTNEQGILLTAIFRRSGRRWFRASSFSGILVRRPARFAKCCARSWSRSTNLRRVGGLEESPCGCRLMTNPVALDVNTVAIRKQRRRHGATALAIYGREQASFYFLVGG